MKNAWFLAIILGTLFCYNQAPAGNVPAYFPTGELYFNAPVDPQTGKLSAHDLAKAYMWLSASAKRSKNPQELSQTLILLKKIRGIMPQGWIPELDAKVAEHLAKYPAPE